MMLCALKLSLASISKKFWVLKICYYVGDCILKSGQPNLFTSLVQTFTCQSSYAQFYHEFLIPSRKGITRGSLNRI